MNEPAGPIPFSLIEQRILGVLIEKQKTTPDVYPLSLNSLTVGCNQKSNRDPVLNLEDQAVEAALEELHRRQLVVRVASGRVDKWKHVLYELWNMEKTELAVLAELFLRGPQTEGELRSRVSRMEPVEDIEAMRNIVKKLSERGFIHYLTPEGRRGTIVGHGCVTTEELAVLKARCSEVARLDEASGVPRAAAKSAEIEELRKELAELRVAVDALAGQFGHLRDRLDRLPG